MKITNINTFNTNFGAYVRIGRDELDKMDIAANLAALPQEKQDLFISELNRLKLSLQDDIHKPYNLAIRYHSFPEADFNSHLISVIDLDNPYYEEIDVIRDKEVSKKSLASFFKEIRQKWIDKLSKSDPSETSKINNVFNRLS